MKKIHINIAAEKVNISEKKVIKKTLNVEKDNSVDATTVATMADDTFITVTWFVDPDRDAIYYSINNATPVKVSNAKLPDDEDLTISFGIQNGEAAGNTLTIDYVNMIVER